MSAYLRAYETLALKEAVGARLLRLLGERALVGSAYLRTYEKQALKEAVSALQLQLYALKYSLNALK